MLFQEEIKNSVWEMRSKFSDDINMFLADIDFLIHGSQKIHAATQSKKGLTADFYINLL